MKKLTSFIIALVISLQIVLPAQAALDMHDLEIKASMHHENYLKERKQEDFYAAQKAYKEILTQDFKNRDAYIHLIELLLSAPKGLSKGNGFYRSNLYDIELNYEPKREYRTKKAYPRYDANAYRFVENPLYEIDVLVNKAYKLFRNDPIRYDKKWLSEKYIQLAEAILATRPNNPSMELDRALILADRALDLDRGSITAKNLRNTFRARHR